MPLRGFKKNQQRIAKRQGVSMKSAGAILAAGTRKAKRKPSNVRKNPRLNRVKGGYR